MEGKKVQFWLRLLSGRDLYRGEGRYPQGINVFQSSAKKAKKPQLHKQET